MKKLFDYLEKIEQKIRVTKTSRNTLYQCKDRIEYLITLAYFLSLRKKIRKEVQENYVNIEQMNPIIQYDDYGFIEVENFDVYNLCLQPMIDEHIKKVVTEIENQTLELIF